MERGLWPVTAATAKMSARHSRIAICQKIAVQRPYSHLPNSRPYNYSLLGFLSKGQSGIGDIRGGEVRWSAVPLRKFEDEGWSAAGEGVGDEFSQLFGAGAGIEESIFDEGD